MLIKVTGTNGECHYLHQHSIARITEAGVSSKWRGIQSIIRTFDHKTIEVRETPDEICALLAPTNGGGNG